jgi:hypothetical protein
LLPMPVTIWWTFFPPKTTIIVSVWTTICVWSEVWASNREWEKISGKRLRFVSEEHGWRVSTFICVDKTSRKKGLSLYFCLIASLSQS